LPIRSEHRLMERLECNLLYRRLVGLGIDEPVWSPTVCTSNRGRLLTTGIARRLTAANLAHERVAPLLSDDHFSVDGTLIEARALFKSFQPKQADAVSALPHEPPSPQIASLGAAHIEIASINGTIITNAGDALVSTTPTIEAVGLT
jgi:hypothetical protein